jgi:hypothetical protein
MRLAQLAQPLLQRAQFLLQLEMLLLELPPQLAFFLRLAVLLE